MPICPLLGTFPINWPTLLLPHLTIQCQHFWIFYYSLLHLPVILQSLGTFQRHSWHSSYQLYFYFHSKWNVFIYYESTFWSGLHYDHWDSLLMSVITCRCLMLNYFTLSGKFYDSLAFAPYTSSAQYGGKAYSSLMEVVVRIGLTSCLWTQSSLDLCVVQGNLPVMHDDRSFPLCLFLCSCHCMCHLQCNGFGYISLMKEHLKVHSYILTATLKIFFINDFCEFYIMYPNPTYPPDLICPPPLQHPQKKISLSEAAVVCHLVYPFVHLYLQMLTAVNHWSGSRPLASATLSILDPHLHSSAILCHEGPATLDLQNQPLYVL